MRSFAQYLFTILAYFVFFSGLKLYVQNVPLKEIYSDLIMAVAVGGFLASMMTRIQSPSSIKVTVSNWNVFWHDFMALVQEAGHSPICKMDDTYFFERRALGMRTQIILKKIAENQWEVEYPQAIRKLVAKKIGLYHKIPMLSVGELTLQDAP